MSFFQVRRFQVPGKRKSPTPPISAGRAEPAIPQPWTSCTRPAPLSCRDAVPAGPGCRLWSLLQPGLCPGSGSARERNPKGQPTPGAKLRAHSHGEGPLHVVLSVKLSAPPQGKHRGWSRASGPMEARGKRKGHASPEPPRATVLVAAWTHTGKQPGAHPHIQSHTHSTRQTHTNTHNTRHTPDTRSTKAKRKGAHPHTWAHTHTADTYQTHQTSDTHHTRHTWGVQAEQGIHGGSQMRECPHPSLCGGSLGTLGGCGVCSSLTATVSTKSPAPWSFSRVSPMRHWEQKLGLKPPSSPQGLCGGSPGSRMGKRLTVPSL